MADALFNPRKINDLLESESTAFLSYDTYYRKIDTQIGQLEIKVPRDRNGEFIQHTLPAYN